MELRHLSAIVTGGASGLGEACVRRIAEAGGKVAIVDLNQERAEALIKEIGSKQIIFKKTDVTSAEEVENNVQEIVKTQGKVNGLINCAGIATPGKVLGRKGVMELAAFEKVIKINLIGTFNMIRVVSDYMKENDVNDEGERGVILNTASAAAFEGQIGQAAYSASKGGVASMTLPLAREFSSLGIRVMTIAPGLFETPMFDTLPQAAKDALGSTVPFPNRLGNPAEYAKLMDSIMANPMLNGEVIRLDGALRMQPK
ncbi:SDR family NAD(P)-dependent oxidoreductase [Virgibacillus sp. DJP39]|uniref:SDR family NAD(P)-dependent oxidoreductase n=1 Tax=Virgibacillus sp. DJP39 TaxID=3409790 RepID=UPI003BB5C219